MWIFYSPATVSFEQSTYNVNEDNGLTQLILVLSNPLSTDTIVQVNNSNGSATGKYLNNHYYYYSMTNTGDVDYDSGPYIVIFPAGMTSVSLNVSIINDDMLEDEENFLLTIDLSSLPNNVTVGDPEEAIVTIVDDDSK